MKLLIVNDEILVAEIMKTEIAWEKYGIEEVFVAPDSKTGKAYITQQSVDIMLCDIEMPEENGIELLRWVRAEKKEIECIFLTCHANFEYAREAISLGCQDYLLMPAKYEDIGEAVRKVVNRIQERRESHRYEEYGKKAVKEQINSATEKFGEKKLPQEFVKDVISYVAQNLGNEDLSVNNIAESLHLHPVYLNRIFKKEKELSIGQYIVSEKMKMAAELLKSNKLSVNAVAEKVGYSGYSNFNFMFKKYYGCTPTQFITEKK